jgi:hypothetical protein
MSDCPILNRCFFVRFEADEAPMSGPIGIGNYRGGARVADRGWKRRFDDPIPLPHGRQLVTLEDAGNYITKLPKAEHEAQEWQAAMEALILVATSGGQWHASNERSRIDRGSKYFLPAFDIQARVRWGISGLILRHSILRGFQI